MTTAPSLAGRIASGDEGALADAYALYGRAVRSYVGRYVGPNDADDVTQRVFLDVWRSSSRLDSTERFSSWLFTIAHRRAVDELRSRRPAHIDLDLIEPIGDDGRHTAQLHADAAQVRELVELLPDHEREVIVLTYFGDLTQAQVADHLQVPLGTVKARASRGTKRLAQLMSQEVNV